MHTAHLEVSSVVAQDLSLQSTTNIDPDLIEALLCIACLTASLGLKSKTISHRARTTG